MDLNRVPPQDIEAEQAVLGSMLKDPEAINVAMEALRKEDFYREDNKLIFEAIMNISNRAEPVDIITLKDELSLMGKLDVVGGLEYIAELPDKAPTSTNVQKYVKIVESKSMLRELIRTAEDIRDSGFNQTEEVEDILDNAEKQIFNVIERKNERGYSSIKEILLSSFDQLEQLANRKEYITGVPSGFTDLDSKTAGFHGSELILIAARPGMGKSALALNIATNAALRGNVPVAIYSLEMSKEQLGNRILCSEALVDSNKVRTGELDDSDWAKLIETSNLLSKAGIYIDDTPGLSVMDIRAKSRKLKLEKDIGLIVIDYLQLISGSSRKGGTREQEVAEISRSLKILAKELNVPVIALSQLSRSVEQREDKRPMLSDLRESGSIEQDADVVMFIYTDEYYNKEDSEKKGISEIIIGKQRGGSTGKVELRWMPSYTKFGNLSRRDENEE